MGIQDFSAIFDVLDPACRGHLTSHQIKQFYESLHFSSIDDNHVTAAVYHVCGSTSQELVTKDKFLEVLQEIDRRRHVEEQVKWDFQALDRTGSYLISVSDALLLFRNTHGENFSMGTWRKFLASRDNQSKEVSFDELRPWLCDHPTDGDGEKSVQEEEGRLAEVQQAQTTKEYEDYKKAKEETEGAQEKEEHRMKVKRGARRKLNRWETEGLEALLYDDGVDRGEDLPSKTSSKVSITDLLDKLDTKYDLLRTKLFWDMIRKQSNSVLLSESDQVDAFQTLQAQERQLRRDGSLTGKAEGLQGGDVSHSVQLVGLMGGVGEQLAQVRNDVNDRRAELQGEGRDDRDVEKTLKNDFERKVKGPVSSAAVLVGLMTRWEAERDELLGRLRGAAPAANKLGQVTVEYGRLERQEALLTLEEDFQAAATSTGLGERPQPPKYPRFDPDRLGQERLASDRLRQRKGRKLKLPAEASKAAKGSTLTELMAAVIKEVTWKQAQEREVLVQLLLGRDAAGSKAAARQLSGPQRHHKQTSLRNQRLAWRNSNAQYRTTHKQQQTKILQDGVGLYYETVRGTLGGSDSAVCTAVLADLQQTQDAEFEELLTSLHTKKDKELENVLVAEGASRKEEQLDTLARLLLGVFEEREEERPLLAALNAKYDALRHVLLLHVVREELGLAWNRLSDEERQRHLVKKKNEELKLRQEGRFEEMGQLISKLPQELGSLRQLMGEDRQEFSRRQKVQAEKKDQAVVQGHDSSLVESNETPPDQTKSVNLLADLLQRYYVEQDFVIGWYRSPDSKNRGQGYLHLPLVMLQVERRMCEREETFDRASLTVGLQERIEAATERRHPVDRERQARLSAARTEGRKQRVENGLPHPKELDEYARPEKGDLVAWMESFLREQNKKHVEERELLLSVLQDPGLEELVEVARTMAPADRTSRLAELRVKRNKMDMEDISQREENFSVIEEAAAIRCVLKRDHLEAGRNDVSHRDVTVDLLTELQDEQDREMAGFCRKLPNMTEHDLKKSREYEINARHWRSAENVVQVLTRHEGEAEDDALLSALDEKYDALRDKLLLEALMAQLGEAEWGRLSEQERQRRLIQLKLKEKRLRRDGDLDELAKLLGDNEQNEEALRKLMGDNRSEYERKLRERLARRQKRIDQGLDPDEDDEGLEETEDADTKTSLLDDLQARYEAEKEALLRQMRGLDSKYLSERERQAELLRLKREARRAQREDKFGDAARLIGLAERQQGELSEKLKNDPLRQEQLAKDRLEALRKRRAGKPTLPIEEVLREGTKAELQDAVMKRLDEGHAHERELLVHLLSQVDADPDLRLVAQASSALEREDKLLHLKDQRISHLGSTSDNHATLQEACIYKYEGRRTIMETKTEGDVTEDDVTVSLLADLQQQQEKEAEEVLNQVLDKESQELVELQLRVIEETKEQRAENVATVLFAPEADDQNDLIAALDSKYDALRDKLLIEALMKQAGEAEWAALTEAEQQRRLAELKLQERQLRRQGKHDEAAALLGDALKNHKTLEALMGQSREEQERRLRERLERRKQRQAQGMSIEECDKLEQEEIEAEEEEDKKKRNVLLDLMKNYDAEKDAILRALRESQSRAERERLRQNQMARLRREQRRAKTESKYDAAAIVLGLAQKQQLSVEAERARQEQLAKERLAARRAARLARQGAGGEEEEGVVVAPSDDKDLAGLQDAVLQETELKHRAEQEALLKILEEESEGTHREAARALNAETQRDKQDELRQRRALWRKQPHAENQQQMELLREGAGICLELTADRLSSEGKDNSQDSLQVALLADLQQHQAHEMRVLSNTLAESDAPTLRQVKALQADARQRQLYDHTALTLLGTDPLPDDDGLSPEEREAVRELEKKYDAARDKLLIEALMREVGEREWAALTEQERQRRLVRLRLEERRLRREGKYDEVAALLGQLSKDQQALQEKLGASRSEQQRRLEERLARRAALKAEREANGQPTDDVLLDAMVEQEMAAKEEEEDKKKNVLENLAHHYEDEKAALLAALRGHEDREARERQRQLHLARLRREKKLMEREEKFDSAAILLSMAARDEQKMEQRYTEERDRQRELAKERLAARRLRQQVGGQEDGEDQERLREAEEKLKAALESASDEGKDGALVLQETILGDMETKHGRERDALMDLLSEVQADPTALKAAAQMGEEEAKMQLEQYRLDRVRWQKESRKASVRLAETDGVTDSEKENLQKTITDGKKDQKTVLLSALAIKLKLEVEALRKDQPGLSDAEALEEAGVGLLADLQTKQTAELSAMEKIVTQQSEPMLVKLKDTQRQSKSCGWYENLNSALFTLPSAPEEPAQEDALPDQGEAARHLEEELQKEKEEHIEKLRRERPGEEIDVEAAMRELEEQQNAKRKALQDAMDRQKRQLKERLEAKRRARETAEYEEEASVALVRNAEREHSFVLEKKQKEQLRQKDLMAQRLAARREARRAAQEEEGYLRETSDVLSDTSSRTNTPSLPGGRMRREKTALNVEVTEDQKKELFSQVVRENADWKRKISADQQRQQDQLEARLKEITLQRRLRDRSNKRQEEADALFSLGMRQKTILEKTKQEERDRQILATKERVARVRYERTMTMKDLGEKKARKFDELVQDQGTDGLSENERMALAAQRMESKFKQERELAGTQETQEGEGAARGVAPAAPAAPAEGGGRLSTREEKMALLKQRRLQKKLQRQKEEEQQQ